MHVVSPKATLVQGAAWTKGAGYETNMRTKNGTKEQCLEDRACRRKFHKQRVTLNSQACAVHWKNFLCCGMLRHASTCTCGYLGTCGNLDSQTRDNMHHAVEPKQSLSPSRLSVVALLTYIIAKWRKVLLPMCKRSFVWMWPIKLNDRSTWQAERGRRTKKTAMLLNIRKSKVLVLRHISKPPRAAQKKRVLRHAAAAHAW